MTNPPTPPRLASWQRRQRRLAAKRAELAPIVARLAAGETSITYEARCLGLTTAELMRRLYPHRTAAAHAR